MRNNIFISATCKQRGIQPAKCPSDHLCHYNFTYSYLNCLLSAHAVLLQTAQEDSENNLAQTLYLGIYSYQKRALNLVHG
jgi:hypothetical protein